MSRWAAIAPGDVVTLRPKRQVAPPQTVTVPTVRERDPADGRGQIDDTGAMFREFFYDVVIHPSAAR